VTFSGYARLWADRRVRVLFAAAFFARIPALAAPLVLTLFVVGDLGGTYTQAGVVAAASTVGAGLGSPWRGRLIDRLGMRRAVVPSVVAVGVLYPLAVVSTYAWLVPLAFLMGLFLIPVFSIVRLSLSVVVPVERRRTAFAADSVVAECSFIIGPAVGALLVTQAGAGVALAAVGACEVLAGVLFLVLNPPTRSAASDVTTTHAAPGAWLSVPVMFVFLISAGATTALYSTDLGIVAELRELDDVGSVGIVFLAWGLASLLGGLVYGALDFSIRPTWLLLALGLTTIPVGLADSVWSLAVLVVPTGLLCAPTLTASAEWLAKLVPEARRGEAMGWQGTAFTVGGAAGSPVIGAVIDGTGAWGGFVVGGSISAVIAIAAWGGQLVPRWRRPGSSSRSPDH
jgi:MFS family permease